MSDISRAEQCAWDLVYQLIELTSEICDRPTLPPRFQAVKALLQEAAWLIPVYDEE